ncbi:MAG: hypothetical protein JOZ65_06150 [Chloroflexi bacterium]|nr:hypothetical protein [Chloroflexota bacterium]
MADPFEALRTAPTPIDPDAAFAARLRARVARALQPSDQGELSMTMSDTVETTNRLRQGDMTYVALWVPDLKRAERFYAEVLGWTYQPAPAGPASLVQGQSMQLGMAELSGTTNYLRGIGVPLPPDVQPTAYPAVVVDDVDAAIQRVRAAGGWSSEANRQPYGVVASCVDNQGLAFTIHQAPQEAAARPPASGARHGDLAYMAVHVPDAARARDFYSSVFGVRFEPGRAGGWNAPDVAPMTGVAGGAAQPTIVPMFRVNDIAAAVERVRSAGGTATVPVHEGYGIRSECADDQGVRFYLGQL